MLALSPLRTSDEDGGVDVGEILLEDINFDDIFVGFDDDGDILPDLEIDPADIFADFSFSSCEDDSGNTAALGGDSTVDKCLFVEDRRDEEDKELSQGEGEVEVVSARANDDGGDTHKIQTASSEGCKGRRGTTSPATSSKISHGKKKPKVDWTPELHRRFVQAVEQLGVDKAVPSRILELMGIDCLTRHNIASHLQKYRSHRKHLLAREAEAASSWSHRSRQMMYTAAGVSGGGGVNSNNNSKMSINPNWAPAPPAIIGFPPPPPPHHHLMLQQQQHHFRQLHVWGHPTAVEHPQIVPMWPRPPWPVPPRLPHALPPDPSYWHHHHPHFQRPLTQGTPCFAPQLLPATMQRYPAPPVPGIPPHPMFKPAPPPALAPPPTKQSSSQPQLDAAQPSKESVDAAIGDVLAKPWLPLPLGLKPPSLESVMVELQKQGVRQVPPTCS